MKAFSKVSFCLYLHLARLTSSNNIWLLCSATASFQPLLWPKYLPNFTSQAALEVAPSTPTHTHMWIRDILGSGQKGEIEGLVGSSAPSSFPLHHPGLIPGWECLVCPPSKPLMVDLSTGLGSWQVISILCICWVILIKWLLKFVHSCPLLNKSAIWEADLILLIFFMIIYYAGFLRHLHLARWFLKKGMVPIVVNPVQCLMNN